MSIIRNAKRRHYVAVDNAVVSDERLSWGARGLLCYLLSKPPEWHINIKHLISQSPVGRDGVYSLIQELQKFGYMRPVRRRVGGRFSSTDWDVFETPYPDLPDTEKPDTVPPHTASPDPVSPYPENPTLVNTEKDSNNGSKQMSGNPSPDARRPKHTYTDADMATAQFIFTAIRKLNPTHKEPSFPAWANDIRLMRERDERSDTQIRELFAWANADHFWCQNILSPAKLRQQWDKLLIRRRAQHQAPRPSHDEDIMVAARRYGIEARPGESMDAFRVRVRREIDDRLRRQNNNNAVA